MFIKAVELEKIYGGNRSMSSARRDYKTLVDILGIKKGMPGIPTRTYAEYIGVPIEDIQERLKQRP